MIEEKGPWAAAFGSNDRAFVESDDFTHDVRLYIDGDFESIEQRVEYAEEIAKRLNTFASRDEEVAKLKDQVKLLRDALLTCSVGDFSTGHVIYPSFDEKLVEEALDATDTK